MNNCRQTLGFGIELPVTQQATHKGRCRILPHVHTHQAVPRMTQLASIEAQVKGKESGATAVPQKGEHLVVLHALPSDFIPDLPERHTPPAQQLSLTFRKIFVQDDHAEVNST